SARDRLGVSSAAISHGSVLVEVGALNRPLNTKTPRHQDTKTPRFLFCLLGVLVSWWLVFHPDRPGSKQRFDLCRTKSVLFEYGARVLANARQRPGSVAGCARQARSRGGLALTLNSIDEQMAGAVVRVVADLAETEHRGDTGIGTVKDLAPLRARLAREDVADA